MSNIPFLQFNTIISFQNFDLEQSDSHNALIWIMCVWITNATNHNQELFVAWDWVTYDIARIINGDANLYSIVSRTENGKAQSRET